MKSVTLCFASLAPRAPSNVAKERALQTAHKLSCAKDETTNTIGSDDSLQRNNSSLLLARRVSVQSCAWLRRSPGDPKKHRPSQRSAPIETTSRPEIALPNSLALRAEHSEDANKSVCVMEADLLCGGFPLFRIRVTFHASTLYLRARVSG